jgi:hypothetical protein
VIEASTRPVPVRLSSLYDRVAPGGSQRTAWLVALGVVAAAPSLVWAFGGAELMHDDWGLAGSYGTGLGNLWGAFWEGAVAHPARPGASLYYAISYTAFGTHPILHALLQAAVNGALGILVFVVAERLWRTELAWWIALVYAALPNRGSTRLWAAVAPNALAVVLVLVAVLLLRKGRPVWAALALAAGVVNYEGVLFLAVLAVASWVLQDRERDHRDRRWVAGAAVIAPAVLAATFMFVRSPKRTTTPTDVNVVDRLISSQFGSAIFEGETLSAIGFAAVVLGLLVLVVLPTARRPRYRPAVAGGAVIFVAAVVPFVLVRWPIASSGFFDRANGVIGLGTAVLLGTLAAWIVDLVPARLGLVPMAGIVMVFAALNLVDVRDYRAAADDGHALLAQVMVDVEPTTKTVRVVPPPEAVGGVAEFPAGSNLSTALRFERGDEVRFFIIEDVEGTDPPNDAVCYDRVRRVVGACPAPRR